MEWGVIHHNYRILRKFLEQMVFKPILKQLMVHRSIIAAWSKDFLSHLSSYNPCARILTPGNLIMKKFPSGGITIFPVQIAIYPGFVHISNLFRWYINNFVLVCCYFVVILLLVSRCFFFRVIFNRFNAFCMADCEQPNSRAISFWYASGCCAT